MRCPLPSPPSRFRKTHRRLAVETLEGRTLLSAVPTSTSFSVSSSALIYGQSETITATVASTTNGNGTPQIGTVTFFDGAVSLGSSEISNGVAVLTTSALSVGLNSISAAYNGFTNPFSGATSYAASASGAVQSVVPTTGVSAPAGVAVDAHGDLFVVDSVQDRVVEITPSGTTTTVASGLADPIGVAVDSKGDVFIADTFNSRVLEVTPSGGQTTVGTGLDFPQGVAVDAAGDVFITDSANNRVLEVTASGTQTTVGSGFSDPEGVAVDAAGDVFIADTGNNRVVEVPKSGMQQTVASGILRPNGVAVDSAGNMYVAGGLLLKYAATGGEMTIGSGITDATAVAVDTAGDVFVSDSGDAKVLEEAPGVSVTVGRTPTSTCLAASSATILRGKSETFTATVSVPASSTAPSEGTVTFMDGTTSLGSSAVSAGVASFTASALAVGSHTITASYSGTANYAASTSGIEPSSPESVVPATGLSDPTAVAVDNRGDVFIADTGNNRVVEVTKSGTQTTFLSGLNQPEGVAVDSAGDVFVDDTGNLRLLEVTASGTLLTLIPNLYGTGGLQALAALSASAVFAVDNSQNSVLQVVPVAEGIPLVGSGLSLPEGVAVDSSGDVFIADTGNGRVIEVTQSGAQTTVASGLGGPFGVAVDSAGDVFISESVTHLVLKVTPAGIQTTIGSGFAYPEGLAVDGAGDLFVADLANNRVDELTPGVRVTVNGATTPTLTWTNPADITFGTPLGATQLDATANVAGTFAYTPAAGTILSPGKSQALSVTFTPTDSTDYTTATATTSINVTAPAPSIIGEQALFTRKLKHGKPVGNPVLIGYMIDFSSKLAPATAVLATNYEVEALKTETIKKKKVELIQPLTNFTVTYSDATESVNLMFTTSPAFKTGGRITVLDGPASGVTGGSGAFLSGNRVLAIAPGGKRISPA